MSDMSIKSSIQAALTSSQKVDVRDKNTADKSQAPQATKAQADTVSLTDAAAQLPTLQQTISNSSGVDSERVESLRAAIADGSYSVDATELAQNMIGFEQGL